MEIYKKLFGQRLRAARKSVPGLTQAKLAEILGVEPPSVSRWETGVDFPENQRLPSICKALRVSIDYFSHDSEEISSRQHEPGWQELSTAVQLYLEADPHRRLLALYILTDDESYLTQYDALPDAPQIASVLKRIL